MITIYSGTGVHQGEVRWCYRVEGWGSKPTVKIGTCQPAMRDVALLWACTEALQMLPPGQDIEFYTDSGYVTRCMDDEEEERALEGIDCPAAVLDTAWKALDNAAARHEIKWSYYDPRVIVRLARRIQMAKCKIAAEADCLIPGGGGTSVFPISKW